MHFCHLNVGRGLTVASLFLVTFLLSISCLQAVETRTFVIAEPFGLAWGPDRVNYEVRFPAGAVVPEGVMLKDETGKAVAAQLSNLEFWYDGRTVKKATLSFMVSLTPGQKKSFALVAGRRKTRQPASDLQVRDGRVIELATTRFAIRLAGGSRTYEQAVDAGMIPAPIQGVRLNTGAWIGKGWWKTDISCVGYKATLEISGPVFARARLRFDFELDRYYEAVVELSAGQDVAVISEDFNLSAGRAYPMTGVDGMKPELRYTYVNPGFPTPDRALIWDWWGQTHAKLPTPNQYFFSVYKGFQPDSVEFEGYNRYRHIAAGDGGLKVDKDGRFLYLNAYPQWGDEESVSCSLYAARAPDYALAFIALRPSRWLHPDILPHPNKTIKQYTQTNCITFERRKSPDVFMRAPVCLGRRVYGIGVLKRDEVKDKKGTTALRSSAMLRHVRLGRCELDTVKDWQLDYEETSKYPRMFVEPGQPYPAQGKLSYQVPKEIDGTITRLREMVWHFATSNYGHMHYGINEGLYAHFAEAALADSRCTSEQAGTIRRYLAAIVYFALHPDFVPPRESGFAWGSANMMAQVRNRCALIAALLPHHPAGKGWRRTLARLITLYLKQQINSAGATLECPHYGTMAITMPTFALAALDRCGGVDLREAEACLAAAAHHRMATLMPYDIRGGFRNLAPGGDGYFEGDQSFAPLSGFFAKRNPTLAGKLVWALRESHNVLKGHPTPGWKLFDPTVKPITPALASEFFKGNGFVMRNGFPARDETFVLVTAGGFSWGHGHNDRGSWAFQAKGVPLMVDFGSMYTPSLREGWLHSGGLTFDHDESIRICPGREKEGCWYRGHQWQNHKVEPFTCLEFTQDPGAKTPAEAHGEVTEFVSLPEADYAVMRRPVRYLHRVPYLLPDPHGQLLTAESVHTERYLKRPFVWTRQFLLVKDPIKTGGQGIDYLVVRDDLAGNTELTANLNLWCLATRLEVKGQTGIYTGQHGVDLHCYVAEPAHFQYGSHTVGHSSGKGFSFRKHYEKTFGKPFREEQIQLRIPQERKGEGYFVVMVPVGKGEVTPTFKTLLGGKAIEVKLSNRTDTIVLLQQNELVVLDGLTLTGKAFLITRSAKGRTVTTLSAAVLRGL